MLCIFLLCQLTFSCKEKNIKNLKSKKIYQFHDRINDENNQIFLKKVIFSNFKYMNQNGGAIYINKNKFNCTLTNCKFDNCIGKNGGAIYLKSNGKQSSNFCSIYNVLFTYCKAINGGALYLKTGDTERHSISIENCTFKYNSATEKGGAIYGFSREKLAVQLCRFEDNEANKNGSSLFFNVGSENTSVHHKLILYRDIFIFTAKENNLVNVFIQTTNIKHTNSNVFLGLCTFSSKSKSVTGYKNLEIVENGKFESFNLTECNCINDSNETIDIQIKSVQNFDEFFIFDCEDIEMCKSESVVEPIPNATDECEVYPSRQDYVGGSGVEFEKACFSNFRSPVLQDGGAIHVINAQVDLETCRFTNCSTEGCGGAIYVILTILDCEVEIEECVFDDCRAKEDGGAVYVFVSQNSNELEVDATACTSCGAGGNGGAFYISFAGMNCNIEFEESQFMSCFAGFKGGAIFFVSYKPSRSTFEELTFTNNSAAEGGACYYSPYAYSKLCRSDFFNNTCTAPNCSSAVYLHIDPTKPQSNSMLIKGVNGKENEINEHENDNHQTSEVNEIDAESEIIENENESEVNGNESEVNGNESEVNGNEDEVNGNESEVNENESGVNGNENESEVNGNENESEVNGNEDESEVNGNEDESEIYDNGEESGSDGDDENEDDDDDDDDVENNRREDEADNLTSRNVVLADNIFRSNPQRDTVLLIIEVRNKGQLLFGKNSFTFNSRDEEAEKMNAKYIKVFRDSEANISFKAEGFVCFAGNGTFNSLDNVQFNCPIVKENHDKDGQSRRGEKNDHKKRKIIIVASIISACVVVVAVTLVIVLVALPLMRRKDIKQYSTNLNNGGDSIVSNINQATTDEDIQL